jgi:SSS family solute:Na+ symporter
MQTRPWGFWKPVIAEAKLLNPDFIPNRNFKRDAINVLAGIVWQMSMVVMPLYIAFRQWNTALICAAVWLASSFFLKKNWYDKLENN